MCYLTHKRGYLAQKACYEKPRYPRPFQTLQNSNTRTKYEIEQNLLPSVKSDGDPKHVIV